MLRAARVRFCVLVTACGLGIAACTGSTAGRAGVDFTVTPTTTVAQTNDDVTVTSTPGTDASWSPDDANPDPSLQIPGIYVGDPELYAQRYHFAAPDRVAYDRYPPVGGPHDPSWPECDGVAYSVPVRNETMVHALEHGAVWIAYNPDTLPAADLGSLTTLVPSVPHLVMTPYPDLDAPLSLQSWGHQLKLDSADDPRFLRFVTALLRNPYLAPEVNATCSQPGFDVDDPPPFDGSAPGPDAVPLDYQPPA